MATKYPFGNDPAKTQRYKAFWNREDTGRPLVGFTLVGWFPLRYFAECRAWRVGDRVTPDMIRPEAWLDDHERLLEEGNEIEDDIFRGVCPTQVAVPYFLPAALGCRLVVLPDSIMAEELKLPLEEALNLELDRENPWFKKYVQFAEALARKAGGRYPVSHNAELGPTDLHGLIRGQGQSIIDLIEEPEKSVALLHKLGEMFRELTQEIWKHIPLFHGGYFDSQYQLWSPGSFVRMQEDVSGLYSPALYQRFVQPVDRMIASHFDNAMMHLHSTSMFLLEFFLEIEEIECFQLNVEPYNIPLKDMLKYFRRVQEAHRALIVRGSFTEEELRLLVDSLDSRGLYLHIMVKDKQEIDTLRPALGM
jgi:hypothetical protein